MPYRDDRTALESRRNDLRRELEELGPKAEALRDAVRAQEVVARELAATEAKLAEIDARRATLLDDVRIASPCKASWEAMTGDDRVRFCGECNKNVYDLSAMPRDEATRLLAEHEGSLCVRLYRRADGTVLTADCPVGLRKKRVRLTLYGAAGAGALTAAAAWSAMSVMGERAMPSHEMTMGKMVEQPDTYVRQELHPHALPGPVLTYRREPQPGRPGAEWTLWADGRVARGQSPVPDAKLDPEAQAVAGELARLAVRINPEAIGDVPAFGDSAISRSYEVYGAGGHDATDIDRARIFGLASQIRLSSDQP